MRALVLALVLVVVGAMPATAHRSAVPRPDLCRQMQAMGRSAGLPASFAMRVGKRESGCNNAALGHNRNGSHDHGWWQLNDILWRDHRMRPRLAACGAHHPSAVLGNTEQAMRRQACAAAALYQLAGSRPWR